MNIFKVLASGRYSFKEEEASALLAWLLNPRMDHGVGFLFLQAFVQELAESSQHGASSAEVSARLAGLANELELCLRTDASRDPFLGCSLELNVRYSVIDVVIEVEDWLFAIENKIYERAVSNTTQLHDQYRGLTEKRQVEKELDGKRIGVVFLVPFVPLGKKAMAEYSSLEPRDITQGDFKCLLSWQRTPDEASAGAAEAANEVDAGGEGIPAFVPSVSGIISSLLARDAVGAIDPIPQYTRDTLKALLAFVEGSFEGYFYKPAAASGLSVLGTEPCRLDRLIQMDEAGENGSVGVMHGLSGLLDLDRDAANREFNYTTESAEGRRGVYLDLHFFCQVAKWLRDKEPPGSPIPWEQAEGPLRWDHLLKIARCFGKAVYVGVRGGAAGLERLSAADIKGKKWQVSSEPPLDQRTGRPSSQWIDGETYVLIIQEKLAGKQTGSGEASG